MPETALGLFPDIGASYFLSRLPGFFGNDSNILDLHILNVKYSHMIVSFCLFHKILHEVRKHYLCNPVYFKNIQ